MTPRRVLKTAIPPSKKNIQRCYCGSWVNDVHGAPLRLRVENQLGFKMVKWIKAIEFAESFQHVYKGEGGYNSDHEYFDTMADI